MLEKIRSRRDRKRRTYSLTAEDGEEGRISLRKSEAGEIEKEEHTL